MTKIRRLRLFSRGLAAHVFIPLLSPMRWAVVFSRRTEKPLQTIDDDVLCSAQRAQQQRERVCVCVELVATRIMNN